MKYVFAFHLNFLIHWLLQDAGLKGKVALFNKVADKHMAGQAVNPFSQGKVGLMPKPVISKEDYGKWVEVNFVCFLFIYDKNNF